MFSEHTSYCTSIFQQFYKNSTGNAFNMLMRDMRVLGITVAFVSAAAGSYSVSLPHVGWGPQA